MVRTRNGHTGHRRILVADWDRSQALTLSALLHTAGYEVASAFNGRDAVMKAARFTPDLLITEPFMGRLSGIEAAHLITARIPDCGVLFLSGEIPVFEIQKAAPEHLVYSFTSKPISEPDLLNAIAYMLGGGSRASRPQSVAQVTIELGREQQWIGPMAVRRGLGEGGAGMGFLTHRRGWDRPAKVTFVRSAMAGPETGIR